MKTSKKIVIVGAGPGGLTAAMLLAHRGFAVEIFEKENQVGGRNASIKEGGFTFDIGPTFLMMKHILDEVFEEAGRKSENYLKFVHLDPMYRLFFTDRTIEMRDDHEHMFKTISEKFPGNEEGYLAFLKKEKVRYDRMYPCLQKSYGKIRTYFHPDFLKAFPYLSITSSMFNELGKYFSNDQLKICFTFQSKYLGMSPWNCPAAFMIIPFIEHSQGIYHVMGGLSEISVAMAKVVDEEGGKIHLNAPVKKLLIKQGRVIGVLLASGEKVEADEVIVNADFSYAMTDLVEQGILKKYSRQKLDRKLFSCSTYMLYLGVDKTYDMPHHSIVFSRDYNKYINSVANYREVGNDLSIYVRNASVTDPTIAPKGMSNIYILVPVANNRSGIKWSDKKEFRNNVLNILKQRTALSDLDKHIVVEKIITPEDWEAKYNVFLGATFNLGHTLMQMLYFRPHNKFEELENCWLVGGGTHPGSGLPTIYESGRITANLLSLAHGVVFESKNIHAGLRE